MTTTTTDANDSAPIAANSERFPFANVATDPAVRDAAAAAVAECDGFISRSIRKYGLADHPDRDDVAQSARLHCIYDALPRYDAARGNKVSTFIYVCSMRFVASEARRLGRIAARHRRTAEYDDRRETVNCGVARETSQDRRIEEYAEDVRANPEKYLNVKQAAAFRAIVDRHGKQMKVVGLELGYEWPSTITKIYKQIRETLIQTIDLDEPLAA